MKLTAVQQRRFAHDGFLLVDDVIPGAELDVLRRFLPEVLATTDERAVRERDGASVRSVYGVHTSSPPFRLLSAHAKLVEPARQLLGGGVYVYQSKLNVKAAFDGDRWDWHQDYVFWRCEDAMPSPRALTVAVFLDDVTEFNGPMVFIPGSHRTGAVDTEVIAGKPAGYEGRPAWISNLTATLKYSTPRESVARLVREHGIAAPKGRAGSALIFDANVVHASQQNISPFSRMLVMISYNHSDNAPSAHEVSRPEFLVSRDTTPIEVRCSDLSALAAEVRHAR